jgi:hypothetical protein
MSAGSFSVCNYVSKDAAEANRKNARNHPHACIVVVPNLNYSSKNALDLSLVHGGVGDVFADGLRTDLLRSYGSIESRLKSGSHHKLRKSRIDVDPRDRFTLITDNPLTIKDLPDHSSFEFMQAIRMNMDSPYVASLHLLHEAPENHTDLVPTDKLRIYDLGRRSTILDCIRYANAVLDPGSMFAISNADIIFYHDTLRFVTRVKAPDVVITLSRHEMTGDGHTGTLHKAPEQSQDV